MDAQPRGPNLARALVRMAAVAGGLAFALLGPAVASHVPAATLVKLAGGAATISIGAAAALWALFASPLGRRRAATGLVLTGTAATLAATGLGLKLAMSLTGRSATVLAQAAAQQVSAASLGDLLFWLVALLVVAGAAGTALLQNIVYCAFSLLATLIGVAILYVYLSADFLAVTQVLIYVGGVLVLILFAIMLTNQIGEDPKISNSSIGLPMGLALAVIAAATLLFVGARGPFPVQTPQFRDTVAPLGDLFLREYLLPFEVASVLLLAALVGAVVMARKELAPADGGDAKEG